MEIFKLLSGSITHIQVTERIRAHGKEGDEQGKRIEERKHDEVTDGTAICIFSLCPSTGSFGARTQDGKGRSGSDGYG